MVYSYVNYGKYCLHDWRIYRLAWWQLWNFTELQAKFNKENSKKGAIYFKKCSFFGHFKLWRPLTFEPVDLGKSNTPQKKAFFTGRLKADLKLEEFLPWEAPDKFLSKWCIFSFLGLASLKMVPQPIFHLILIAFFIRAFKRGTFCFWIHFRRWIKKQKVWLKT